MEITIKDKTITLKRTFRSLIAFESATGHAFNPTTITESIMYFYCVIIASDTTLEITYDEFMDWLDENPVKLNEFTEWLISQNKTDEMFAKKKNIKTKKNS